MAVASPSPAAPRLTALVLAAGEGKRFDPSGRRWKLVEALPDGRPIVRGSCENLLGQVDEIVVVSGERESELAYALAGLPLRFAHCTSAAAGMGASLKCGLRATAPSVGWLLALADMPFVATATLASLASRLQEGATIVRPAFAGQPGHPVGFAAALRERLLAIDDSAGAAALVRSLADQVLVLPVDDPGCVRDIDRPADIPHDSRT
jgi:molybdenum cofactor cytidylyltransferase